MDGFQGLNNAMSCSVLLPSSFLRGKKQPPQRGKIALKNPKLAKAIRQTLPPKKSHKLVDLSVSVMQSKGNRSVGSTSATTPRDLYSRQSSNSSVHKQSPIERRNTASVFSRKKRIHSYHQEHLEETHRMLRGLKSLPPVPASEIKRKRVFMPGITKKTIIFDLDETLVYACNSLEEPHDVLIKVPLGKGIIKQMGIKIRPHLQELLEELSGLFEIVVFTASQKEYADQAINHIDPDKRLVSHRFYRDSCLLLGGLYIKDLRIFENRKMSNVVIVDNLAHSFVFQLNNGVPITSWFGNPHDSELKSLLSYLKSLNHVTDVRITNQETFRFSSLFEKTYE